MHHYISNLKRFNRNRIGVGVSQQQFGRYYGIHHKNLVTWVNQPERSTGSKSRGDARFPLLRVETLQKNIKLAGIWALLVDSPCVEMSMFSFCNWPLITVFTACGLFLFLGRNNQQMYRGLRTGFCICKCIGEGASRPYSFRKQKRTKSGGLKRGKKQHWKTTAPKDLDHFIYYPLY